MAALHIRDSKTVYLILYLRQKIECVLLVRNGYLSAVCGYGTGTVLAVLHHTEKRNIQRKLFKERSYSCYLTQTAVKKAPVRNKDKKVGPNDPCPCGSGKKYKKCCMQKDKNAGRQEQE